MVPFAVGRDPMGGIQEVASEVGGRNLSSSKKLFPIAGLDQNGGNAESVAKIDVTRFIANDEALPEVQIALMRCFQGETKCWFAAGAACGWYVRTYEITVQLNCLNNKLNVARKIVQDHDPNH